MKISLRILGLSTLVLMASNVRAADISETKIGVGEESLVEVDGQLGSFSGVTVKGFFVSIGSWHLGAEGSYGVSYFSRYSVTPTTYGLGVRGETSVGDGPSHSWRISPGLDVYYVHVNHVPVTDLGSVFAAAISDQPTPNFSIAPNVDFQWALEIQKHLDLVVGARLGIDIITTPVLPSDDLGNSNIWIDAGVYIGLRL